jgi:hypothetical protein
MKLANFTAEQLKALPVRAIVALAARCARRVEHLSQLPEENPQREKRREAIEADLRMADSFARGPGALSHTTADLAAMNAYTAAAEAFISVDCRNENFVDASLKDYHMLVRLQLGRYPEQGNLVDPFPGGPVDRL